jgi:hypothetical protein
MVPCGIEGHSEDCLIAAGYQDEVCPDCGSHDTFGTSWLSDRSVHDTVCDIVAKLRIKKLS